MAMEAYYTVMATRAFENFNVVAWTIRKWLTILAKLIHDHVDDLIDVLECFVLGRPLRYGAKVAQRRAIRVITALIWFYYNLESIRLHGNVNSSPQRVTGLRSLFKGSDARVLTPRYSPMIIGPFQCTGVARFPVISRPALARRTVRSMASSEISPSKAGVAQTPPLGLRLVGFARASSLLRSDAGLALRW